MNWQTGNITWQFPRPTMVMGIINVTPDSFSDGGKFSTANAAVAHALQLAAEGAELLDVGGESTRPGAPPVDEAEELRRVIPVIEKLAGETDAVISIDTQKPTVAKAAVAVGARVINDIAAHRADDAMWRVAAESGAGYIAMHMQGTPQTMQNAPEYDDVVATVEAFFAERLEAMAAVGLPAEQVALDPGIGFGKTAGHNLALLAGLTRFTKFQRPLMVGASRKSFLGGKIPERLDSSIACACRAAADGAHIVRVHDVRETVQALRSGGH
ncbi:MAG: dihydropteroate synthase [Verrucomicrobia subdivision 3 bacterium]|nr:dihydropteroate synthase [Limisphaerales bacterium]